ncbi:SAM-dependent methyltransferase [Paenibacillus sp. CECT 9249]|uniref:class I SAM-dependent methyltransferase n=1 Tax=Paenibacillus sp. CECT 9249 TaxID=2845385 RepID=UPI001E5B4832|nr:SAM-dependent methyltransferase [Paenibacillus sp. CECT 9249]
MSHYRGSANLIQHIYDQIDRSGRKAIPFSTYMESCLYHPEYGYYMTPRMKIGKDGDFYTSSSIGTVMGETLASYIVKRIDAEGWKDGEVAIVEWGAGNGNMAVHAMLELERMKRPIRYAIVEQSPYHRELAGAALDANGLRAEWWSSAEFARRAARTKIVLIANELLDAFPVERLRVKEGRLEQLHVARGNNADGFAPAWLPAEGAIADRYGRLPWTEGQQFEANDAALAWLRRMAAAMSEGYMIAIDYGDEADELFGAHRMNGTFVCYYKHRAHDDAFLLPGEQDMTAHVDFTACIAAGEEAGLESVSYGTQKQFLVEAGILERLQNDWGGDPFGETARRNRAIRQLLLSDQMSELFKVWIARKKATGA